MKLCSKCEGVLRYVPYMKADICIECGYRKNRPDAIMLQKTLNQVVQEASALGIGNGDIINQAVNIAVQLQIEEHMSLVAASQKALQQVKEGSQDGK